MELSIGDFSWILIVGLGGLAAFVYYVSNLAEDGINSESKRKLQKIVKNFKSTPTFRHSFLTFTLASDVYFGESVVSLKSFGKSAVLSFFWVVIIAIVCVFLLPNYRSWFTESGISNLIFEYGLSLFIFVVILDFISVSSTRLIVRKSKPSGIVNLILILIIDLFISVSIFYIGFSSAKYLIVNPSWLGFNESLAVWLNLDQLPIMLQTLNDITADMLKKQADGTTSISGGLNTEITYAFPEGIAFYSSLLTSIWLWLHTLSYILFKGSLYFDKTKSWLLSFTNIDNKPFKSLATISLIVYIALVPLIIGGYILVKE
jgi:hypothetical protein